MAQKRKSSLVFLLALLGKELTFATPSCFHKVTRLEDQQSFIMKEEVSCSMLSHNACAWESGTAR